MYLTHFAIEEFAKSSEPFIKSRKETNILNFVCSELTSKIEIVKHVVAAIKKKDKIFFPTHAHIIWTMECIGYSFSLPIDQHPTIFQAIEIYRNWLGLTNDTRPLCIDDDELFYQQEIISHFSLLFIDRGGDIHKHLELCKEALLILKDLSRKKSLDKETWNHLLKIILIISSSLIKNNSQLYKDIAPLLYKTLFEIWFRSNTREKDLWDELSKHIQHCFENIWVIYHWNSIISGLTSSVIALVYSNDKPNLIFNFRALQKPFDIDPECITFYIKDEENNLFDDIFNTQNSDFIYKNCISTEQVVYFWYNFLTLISKSTISKYPTESEVCTELVKSFASLTDKFLSFSQSQGPILQFSPKENLAEYTNFSKLLEEFSSIHQNYKAEKCRIPVPRVNSILELFGNWLFSYANCDFVYCEKGRAKALAALCRIFSSDLGPVNTEYAGKFYKTIQNTMKAGISHIIIKNILKNSTQLLSANLPGIRILIDKDYILKPISLQLFDKKSDPKLRNYCYDIISSFVCCSTFLGKKDVTKLLQDLLLDSVKNENDPNNFIKAIWIVAGFIGTLTVHSDFVQALMMALTNRLKNVFNEKMCLNLIFAMSTIPFLIVTQHRNLGKNAAKVVHRICLYIKKHLPNNQIKVVEALLTCIEKWLFCYPDTLCDTGMRQVLLEVLTLTRLDDGLRDLSLYLEELIMSKVGLQTPFFRINTMTQIEAPRGFVTYELKYPKYFMIFNNTLAALYGNGDNVYILLRNRIGRAVWKSKVVFSDMKVKKCLKLNLETLRFKEEIEYVEEVDKDFDLSERELGILKDLSSLRERQKGSSEPKPKKKLRARPKAVRYMPNDTSRLLLGHLGLLDYDMILHISEIDTDTANMKISELDQFPEKEPYFYTILNISSHNSTDFLSQNDYFSPLFKLFLTQQGIKLTSQDSSLGFFSHLKFSLEKFSSLIYFADQIHEVVAIVPSLSPGSLSLHEIVADWPIVVLWDESYKDKYWGFPPDLLSAPELQHKECILLKPLTSQMVRVTFFPPRTRLGPLLHNAILPLPLLSKLLIYTIINITGNSLESVEIRKHRQDLLEQAELICKNEDPTSNHLSSMLNYTFR